MQYAKVNFYTLKILIDSGKSYDEFFTFIRC